jgi:hypothetical protein
VTSLALSHLFALDRFGFHHPMELTIHLGWRMRKPLIKYVVLALPVATVRKLFEVFVNASLKLVDALDSKILDFGIRFHFELEQRRG